MGEQYCSFIGQRPITFSWGYDEENEDFLTVRGLIKAKMTALVESGKKNFISDMSLGICLSGAEIALELRDELDSDIRLVCVLPYERQAVKWSAEHRERYFRVLALADKSIVLQSDYSDDCYKKCSAWQCRYSSNVIAVYNYTPNSSAAKQVAYAKKQHINITVINPDKFTVEEWVYDRNRLPV